MIAATDVPLWATLLIGLAGGVLGTLFTIGHERVAEFRTKMLPLADEFLQTLTDAANRVGDVRALVTEGQAPKTPADEAFEHFETARDELGLMLGRINLLFGADSSTWDSASRAYEAIANAGQALRALQAGQADAENVYIHYARQLKAAADSFGADARGDVRAVGVPPLRRVVETTRTARYRATRRTAVPRYRLRSWLSRFRRR